MFIILVIILLSSFTGCPTKPISTTFSILESLSFVSTCNFVAVIKLLILPDTPIAFPPEEEIDSTISELISFDKTSSTIFIVSLSVTLNPSTNLEEIFLKVVGDSN